MKDAILDIGSNDGINSICLALLNPKMKIYSFEINPSLLKLIKKNKRKMEKLLKQKIKNLFIQNFGLSSSNKKKKFYIYKNNHLSSLHRINFKNVKKYFPSYMNKNFNHFELIKIINVKLLKLESFVKKYKIKSIAYYKSDTQGEDLNILRGGGDN